MFRSLQGRRSYPVRSPLVEASGISCMTGCISLLYGGQTELSQDHRGGGAAPRHCLASGHTDRAYQKRTKYRPIYRYLPLLALSNLFRVNSRWEDGDRVKVAVLGFTTTNARRLSKHMQVVQGIAYCGSDCGLEKRTRLTCNLPLYQLPIFTDGHVRHRLQRHRQGVTRMSELARPHECTLVG